MPIEARFSWIVGVMLTCGGVVLLTNRTFLQTGSSHMPSPLWSYFDCFISFLAAFKFPRKFGLGNGSYLCPLKLRTVDGISCVAICPWIGPPHAFRRVALSMTSFTARRTWTSSNGGVSRFMVMYQVVSAGSECSRPFSCGLVTYCWRTCAGGWLASDPSNCPVRILLKMSSVFESISMETPLT